MGMYDKIIFNCKNCGFVMEKQSKADECMLAKYWERVPKAIAEDIIGDTIKCEKCGIRYYIEQKKGDYVYLDLVELN